MPPLTQLPLCARQTNLTRPATNAGTKMGSNLISSQSKPVWDPPPVQQPLQPVSSQTKAHRVLSSLCRRARRHWTPESSRANNQSCQTATPRHGPLALALVTTHSLTRHSLPGSRGLAHQTLFSLATTNPKCRPLSNPESPNNNPYYCLFRTSDNNNSQHDEAKTCSLQQKSGWGWIVRISASAWPHPHVASLPIHAQIQRMLQW